MKTKFVSLAVLAAATLVGPIYATTITAPTGLPAGSPYYVVFVTNTKTDSTSNDLSYYDQIAQSDADANGLGTYRSQTLTWQAIGSVWPLLYVGTAANDRLPDSSIPIYLPDGTLIANNITDLWTTGAANAVDEAADGTTVNTSVWTGSSSNGDKSMDILGTYTLGNGDSSDGNVTEYGQSNVTGTGWIDSGALDPSTELPVFAFTEIVPLPSSAAMTAAGLGLLAAYVAGRKLLKPSLQHV